MHVDIWSDVACPWCYVGTQRFGRAVQETGADVDVVYRSFELDPSVPAGDSPCWSTTSSGSSETAAGCKQPMRA